MSRWGGGGWDGLAVTVQATVGGGRDTETRCHETTELGDHFHHLPKSADVDSCRGQDVFVVDGMGKITAAGGLETGNHGHVVAGGRLAARGATVLEMRQARRYPTGDGSAVDVNSSVVVVDASDGTFFEVSDDGRSGFPNELHIKVGTTLLPTTVTAIGRMRVSMCSFIHDNDRLGLVLRFVFVASANVASANVEQ